MRSGFRGGTPGALLANAAYESAATGGSYGCQDDRGRFSVAAIEARRSSVSRLNPLPAPARPTARPPLARSTDRSWRSTAAAGWRKWSARGRSPCNSPPVLARPAWRCCCCRRARLGRAAWHAQRSWLPGLLGEWKVASLRRHQVEAAHDVLLPRADGAGWTQIDHLVRLPDRILSGDQESRRAPGRSRT